MLSLATARASFANMFQIDRSYINHESLESLQGLIWDIRTDHKNDPTLPRIETYGITEEAFEDYLERKQRYLDFQDSWRRHRLLILGVAFAWPVALCSLFIPRSTSTQASMLAYGSAFMLCLLIAVGYMALKAIKGKPFRDTPSERFINALLYWEEQRKAGQVS